MVLVEAVGFGLAPRRRSVFRGSETSTGRFIHYRSPSNPTYKTKKSSKDDFFFWRKRWDSNPRALAGYLISSQGRYDHFDTLPYIVKLNL